MSRALVIDPVGLIRTLRDTTPHKRPEVIEEAVDRLVTAPAAVA
ncbi:MAG TPA: hypothetical protein VNA28_14680 [Solirubrobacteraceae bacterium]|nr:hypothetical protein [Solirubrobacteraceae bacterium]